MSQENYWIKINTIKKRENTPSEIRIDLNGNVYIDGKPFDEKSSTYENLSIDVQKHNKRNLGEDTQKIIESSKIAKKGETVIIKDVTRPDSSESTTVKF